MNSKEKIKDWVKNLKLQSHTIQNLGINALSGFQLACDDVIAFIDSLPEEPLSKDLEREIGLYTTHSLLKKRNHDTGVYHLTQKDCDDIARYFAEWQKQQMMKDAADSKITTDGNSIFPIIKYQLPLTYDCKIGDKVKLIIIKEEQQ